MRALIRVRVMVPELTAASQLNALALSSCYASFALVAGASLDRYGAEWTIPAGIACIAVGTAMFGSGSVFHAEIGRLLQVEGSAARKTPAIIIGAPLNA